MITKPNPSAIAPLVLKVTGGLLIIKFLLDLIVLLTTANFQENQWVLTFTTQLIEQGFLPLVGLTFLFLGFWVEDTTSNVPRSNDLKLVALLLSSVLGLVFLLLIPLNINSTRLAADNQVQQIGQEATKAESQLESQVQQFRGQIDVRLSAIDQAIKSGQLQGDQLAQAQGELTKLQQLKANPKALDAQVSSSRNQELTRIRNRKQELENQTRQNATRSGLRTGLNSFLLAMGYIIIGWNGLRQLQQGQRPRYPEL